MKQSCWFRTNEMWTLLPNETSYRWSLCEHAVSVFKTPGSHAQMLCQSPPLQGKVTIGFECMWYRRWCSMYIVSQQLMIWLGYAKHVVTAVCAEHSPSMDDDSGYLAQPRSIHCCHSECVPSVATETTQPITAGGWGHGYYGSSRARWGGGDFISCDDTIRSEGRSPQ